MSLHTKWQEANARANGAVSHLQPKKNLAKVFLAPTAATYSHQLCNWFLLLLTARGVGASHPESLNWSYLSSAEPWLWLLVRREKTLRSLRGLLGGDEGGVNPTSGVLEEKERYSILPQLVTLDLSEPLLFSSSVSTVISHIRDINSSIKVQQILKSYFIISCFVLKLRKKSIPSWLPCVCSLHALLKSAWVLSGSESSHLSKYQRCFGDFI